VQEGYHDYVHKGLWPVFHQRPDLAEFSASGRREYQNLNGSYARVITEYAMPDDLIWIQDYHLLASARYVREAGLNNPAGYFLHQPFPSGKIFEAVPEWCWLAESLLFYDLIGFLTIQDINNIVIWLESQLRIERLAARSYRVQGDVITTGGFPVDIEPDDVRCLLDSNTCEFMYHKCHNELPENTVLSGGHLDDSAGLPYRISALGVLLKKHAC
jgi:trehalose 6-phosphate synthase